MKHLNEKTINEIKSSYEISNVVDCVIQLVYNSIDANSTLIKIKINFNKFDVEVTDNGDGISENDLCSIGYRNMTDKTNEDKQKFGYMGDSLFNLILLSDKVEIQTRKCGSGNVYKRSLKLCDNGEIESSFSGDVNKCNFDHGTVIRINNLFNKLPIRQKQLSKQNELKDIEKQIQAIYLLNYKIEFILIDVSENRVLVHIEPTTSMKYAFSCLFGNEFLQDLIEYQHEFNENQFSNNNGLNKYKIKGVISNYMHNLPIQYVFINNFQIENEEIYSFINGYLSNSNSSIKLKSNSKYALFSICIQLPLNEYYLTKNKRKSVVFFKSANFIMQLLRDYLNYCFKKETYSEKTTLGLKLKRYSDEDIIAELKVCLQSKRIKKKDDKNAKKHDDVVINGVIKEDSIEIIDEKSAANDIEIINFDDAQSSDVKENYLEQIATMNSNEDYFCSWFDAHNKKSHEEIKIKNTVDNNKRNNKEISRFEYYKVELDELFQNSSSSETIQESVNLQNDMETNNEIINMPAFPNQNVWQKYLSSYNPRSRLLRAQQFTSNNEQVVENTKNLLKNTLSSIISKTEENLNSDLLYRNQSDQGTCMVDAIKLEKSIFENLQVISQFESKFIVCSLRSSQESIIFLFDQHASHERIRLEKIINNNIDIDGNLMCEKPFMDISITYGEEKIKIIENLKHNLNRLGLWFTIQKKDTFSKEAEFDVKIEKVPKHLLNRIFTANNKLSYDESVNELSNVVKRMFENECLHKTNETNKPIQLSEIPQELLDYFNEDACRGAIKFGDKLTIEECKNIVMQLSNCLLPFQCAHGRPTVTPIVRIKKNEAKSTKINYNQLNSYI